MAQEIIPVIIINYAQPANTLEALQSLRDQDNWQKFIPVVVDLQVNSPLLSNIPTQWKDWVHHLPQTKNLGFTGSNNAGYHYCLEKWDPEFVILLNDDTKIGPQAFTKLIETLQANSKAALAVPKIYFYPGCEFHKPTYSSQEAGLVIWYAGGIIDWKEIVGSHWGVDEVDRGQFEHLNTTHFATGCALAIRCQALTKKEIFDPRYFLYLEDLDLSVKLTKQGWHIAFVPDSKIWHKNAGSSKSGSKLQQYYQTRNRFLFGWRWANWRTRLFLVKLALHSLRSQESSVRQGARDFILKRYGKNKSIHQ